MEVWKSGRDGAWPQCRVQVEEGKVNGWISGSGRQWIHDRENEGRTQASSFMDGIP